MARIKIKDESGDKKYWTQIPNYIANHSTAIDQSLYFQMKRYAGETGVCFATQETIMKKMSISSRAFNKSLKYLLGKGWIKFVGKTKGKTRPINTYAIVDIWKLNIMEYEKESIKSEEILVKSNISLEKILVEKGGDTCSMQDKILVEKGGRTITNINNNQEEDISTKVDTETAVSVPNKRNVNIDELLNQLKEENDGLIDGSEKENRRYCYLLLNKFGYKNDPLKAVNGVKVIIGVAGDSDFHAKNATSFKYLFYHAAKIVQEYKNKGHKPLITVI